MSIFRLNSCENAEIDSRYVQSIDLSVHNTGDIPFDMLIEVSSPAGGIYTSLCSAGVQTGPIAVQGLGTNFIPFTLLLVSSLDSFFPTAITVVMRQGGVVVAVVNQEHFTRLH